MKSEKVRKLYDRRAWFYDLAHHLQTLWADDVHRNAVVEALSPHPKYGAEILEIGTGTGITACMLAGAYQTCRVTAVDFSEKMLEKAEARARNEHLDTRVTFFCADATKLPFDSNTFDYVVSAYGLGGIEDLDSAFSEIKRVAMPNAGYAFAEMTMPPEGLFAKRMIHKYLVEPWVRFWWGFRDIELRRLAESNGMTVENEEYFSNYFLGSTTLIAGTIVKKRS